VGLVGHFWTLGPALAARYRIPAEDGSRPWRLVVEDERVGPVPLTGFRLDAGDGRRAALLLHGLGGSAESGYLEPMVASLAAAGWSSLRLNLRGADRSGADLYHAGLTADLPSVLASPPFDRAERIALVGFSLGGHVALRFATESEDPRFAAVVSICAPLDLDRGANALDTSPWRVYRWYLLEGLNEAYTEVAARRSLPVPVDRVRRARTIREWDGLAVAPRFGFASAEDYYEKASVAPRLGRLARPALLVWSTGDPMVPYPTVEPFLGNLPSGARVAVTPRGGHVGFPRDLDLGLGGERGLQGQVTAWLGATAGPPPGSRVSVRGGG